MMKLRKRQPLKVRLKAWWNTGKENLRRKKTRTGKKVKLWRKRVWQTPLPIRMAILVPAGTGTGFSLYFLFQGEPEMLLPLQLASLPLFIPALLMISGYCRKGANP